MLENGTKHKDDNQNRRSNPQRSFLVEHKEELTQGCVFEVKPLMTNNFFCQTFMFIINILSARVLTVKKGGKRLGRSRTALAPQAP